MSQEVLFKKNKARQRVRGCLSLARRGKLVRFKGRITALNIQPETQWNGLDESILTYWRIAGKTRKLPCTETLQTSSDFVVMQWTTHINLDVQKLYRHNFKELKH